MDFQENDPDWAAHVGEELRKTYRRYQNDGFFDKYFAGPDILDIGYKGYLAEARPIFPHAIGIDLDYPGYDGRILPFPDASQDTVFASHTLEHISDYRQALAEWFRVLRTGGHLVVTVPHQYLYERTMFLPSRFNGDHRRLYTPGSLLAEVEDSLDPMSYRVRLLRDNDDDFDYTIPPDKHAEGGGCYEIVLVLQRIARPVYAEGMLTRRISGPAPGQFLGITKIEGDEPLLTIESTAPAARILVMKLDHRGDFLNAYPAFEMLRRRFADAHITLACGSWSAAEAAKLGWFDEVIVADVFPEVASHAHSDFYAQPGTAAFTRAMTGRQWDLAIDLRVDSDSRPLLGMVNATHRAGFGSHREFKFLDIFLPYINPTVETRAYQRVLSPDRFNTRVGQHEGYAIINRDARIKCVAEDILIFGPYTNFEAGDWDIEVLIEPLGKPFELLFDVSWKGGEYVHLAGRLAVRPGKYPRFALAINDSVEGVEIRLRAAAAGFAPIFKFLGAKTRKKGELPALHQQEMNMLLVNLIGLRMENPYTLRAETP